MEVIEQEAEGLERKFTVKVPATELDAKLTAKLEDIKDTVHLKGFRKGKAPLSFLKKMYGKGMMGEIVQEVINETSLKAFSDRDLQPAQSPHPQLEGDIEDVVAGSADLEYMVHAEVLPEIQPIDVATLKLEKPVAEIPEGDLEESLNNLADQQKSFEARAKTAKAKDGDMVVIDFLGKLEGEPFDGGKGEGHELILGSDSFIPGFEEQLVGAKAGDEKIVTVTFPAEYHSEDLKGKETTFDVTVHEVKAPTETEINEEFAKNIGFDTLDELKKRLSERLEGEYSQLSRGHVKRSLLDQLDAAHSFELPKSMVDAEFNQIWSQVENAERDEEDKDKSEDELKEEYRTIAERRVRLGLLLAEIGKRADVQVPQEQLQRAIQEQAMRESQMMQMQGQEVSPQEVLQFYQQNPGAIAQIRAPLFEEKVVDYIMELADVTEKTVSKEELMKEPEGDL